MSVADPFVAFGVGNGFPFCVEKSYIDPSRDFISGLSISEAMALYWNIERFRVRCSVTLTTRFFDNPNYVNVTDTYSFDGFAYKDDNQSPPVPSDPDGRTCNSAFSFAIVVAPGDVQCTFNHYPFLAIYKRDGDFRLSSTGGVSRVEISINPTGPNGPQGLVFQVKRNGNPSAPQGMPSTETAGFETGQFWGKDIELDAWKTTRDIPHTSPSYISHTFHYLTIEPEFYTYA